MKKQVENRVDSEDIRRKHALELLETWLKDYKKTGDYKQNVTDVRK